MSAPPSTVVLEEDFDPSYEPTQDEIVEYAEFLGMHLQDDNDLMWIAREGLKAPLPKVRFIVHALTPTQTTDKFMHQVV